MFSKKPVIDQFSNEALGKFLESLPWIHVDDTNRELAREIVHLRTVEKISLVWSKIIASLDKFTIGNYGYRIEGNRIQRTGSSIKYSGNSNPLVRLSSPFKIKIKKREKQFVVSVE